MIETKFDVEVIAAGEKRVLGFADGATIFRKDEAADCAYIVKAGRIEIRGSHALDTIEPGEIFGEMALIDEERRTAAAVAAGPVEVIPIDRGMFEVLLRDDSDFALTIMRLMVRRLRATMRLLERHRDGEPVERLKASGRPAQVNA